ncbi:MAG: 5-dehydro-2-deoxygluconokinase [Actinobacteria bacterium 69-20]|nr:5-dehydro-2-deoxygluconokinase [Actinomycetota bacterium]OJV26562.1 MAG: 5-dehydro-2-deoxygluconokinase [Actinobacteria bacterium 69-20]
MTLQHTIEAPAPFDLITMGRISADLYPLEDGIPLEQVTTFRKYLGGSATNVAVAAARHGLRTAVITGVGDDPFGRFCLAEVRRLGVDNRFVFTDPVNPTPLAFCEIFPPDDFPLYFRREPKAPDLTISADRLDLDAIGDARVFWATVTGLSQQPSRDAHLAAWQARGRKPYTVLDLDYRAMFWPSRADAHREVAKALEHVTVAVGNLAECEVAVGETDPDRAADALLDRGVELAVVKQGSGGVLAKTRTDTARVPPYPVTVVNGLGAGDGFGGALVYGLISGWPLDRILRFANVAGAIVASRRECSTAMPDTREVLERLAGN